MASARQQSGAFHKRYNHLVDLLNQTPRKGSVMSDLRMYKTFTLIISIALLASACGSSQQTAISTSVAQTVQAGQSLTEIAGRETALPTSTPGMPGPETTLTPIITPTTAATLVSAPADPNCAKASLVGENPPDQTILTPGAYFWKTWTLQ